MIRWTGLAPLEFQLPFPCSLTSTFLVQAADVGADAVWIGQGRGAIFFIDIYVYIYIYPNTEQAADVGADAVEIGQGLSAAKL